MTQTKRSIRIWGCGGCGINLVKPFHATTTTPHTGDLQITLLDTSGSNVHTLDSETAKSIVYRIPDVDGSGKIRAENADRISEHIGQIVLKQKPLDFNIVVFSASGGSGSVFGPLLMRAIAETNAPVVGVVVGTDESLITTRNSLNTLKSLEVLSQRANVPLVIWYGDNSAGRDTNDANAQAVISILSILASGTIAEIDSEDIRNWLRVDRSTGTTPGLGRLVLFNDTDIDSWADVQAVSVASVCHSTQTSPLPVTPDYHTQGYADLSTEGLRDIHLAVDPTGLRPVVFALAESVKSLQSAKDLRRPPAAIVGDADAISDDGLIL